MSIYVPDVPVTFGSIVDWLDANLPCPVYEHGAPADVDPTKPWVVIQFAPGGGGVGSAAQQNRRWQFAIRVIGAARTPNAQGQPTRAVYAAAMWAAGKARAALLSPACWEGADVVTVETSSSFGEDHEADVVNVTDDYIVTVDTTDTAAPSL